VAAGAAVIAFSGDKLLGGPQAGILLGRADLLTKIKKHPLARAIRADKITLAALAATLLHYLKDEATHEIPVWRMIALPLSEIERRAQQWRAALGLGEVGTELEFVIMVIAVSCVKLLSAHNSTQHTSRKHKV
jgi:L-seryl-tRNA(Sec) selenium transferase (EC 2.9.1.1)